MPLLTLPVRSFFFSIFPFLYIYSPPPSFSFARHGDMKRARRGWQDSAAVASTTATRISLHLFSRPESVDSSRDYLEYDLRLEQLRSMYIKKKKIPYVKACSDTALSFILKRHPDRGCARLTQRPAKSKETKKTKKSARHRNIFMLNSVSLGRLPEPVFLSTKHTTYTHTTYATVSRNVRQQSYNSLHPLTFVRNAA